MITDQDDDLDVIRNADAIIGSVILTREEYEKKTINERVDLMRVKVQNACSSMLALAAEKWPAPR